MTNGIYVKLEDVLTLLPEDDICGPKPTHLRKLLVLGFAAGITIPDFSDGADIAKSLLFPFFCQHPQPFFQNTSRTRMHQLL